MIFDPQPPPGADHGRLLEDEPDMTVLAEAAVRDGQRFARRAGG